jgi:hypothetical protein
MTPYEAGHIRKRANPEQMRTRYDALIQIVTEAAPTGVRFTYYRAVSKAIVPKTNNGYVMVQRALMHLRETGAIPWASIVDSSRWMRKGDSWGSLDEMLEDAASSYRRDLWRTADTRVEVWCESESVAGVIGSETFRWDVPLFPIKGQTSASFAHSAAMQYRDDPRPVVIYYVGDHDPAGLEIEANLAAKLRAYSGRADVRIRRLACTPEQIEDLALIGTSPKKRSYSHPELGSIPFAGLAVEVEAIDAPVLRQLVSDALVSHIDPERYRLHRIAEQSERDVLTEMIGGLR